MDIEKYFDRIYCINLPQRKDRLLNFRKNFCNLGTDRITYFNAIDGSKVIDQYEWEHSKGSLGCRLSHLTILKEAQQNNLDKILVFEDDAIVLKSFRKKFEHLLNIVGEDWDMIYFGGNHFLQPDIIDNIVIKLNNTITTHAFAINNRCFAKLIDKIEWDKRWIDCVIADLHLDLKVYGFKKMPVRQLDGYSDIAEMKVSYHPSFIKRLVRILKKVIIKVIKPTIKKTN